MKMDKPIRLLEVRLLGARRKEPIFGELKDVLFFRAKSEMEGYLKAREKWGEKMAEVQRQRYVSLYQVIDQSGLSQEFNQYKMGQLS